MHQFGWLSERGGVTFLICFGRKRWGRDPRRGFPQKKRGGGGVPTVEETMLYFSYRLYICYFIFRYSAAVNVCFIRFYLLRNEQCYLKLVHVIFYQNFIFSASDSPSKTMKNIFYFI